MSRLAVLAVALVCVSGRSLAVRAQPAAEAAAEPPAATARPASEPTEAERLFQQGVELAGKRAWAEAAAAFERSYAMAARPEALFAWAQAERLGGRCEQAVPLYQRFLALGPRPEHAQAAEIGLRRCAAAPVQPPPPAPARRADWIGGGLVALGTAGVGAGLLLVTLSVSHERAAGRSGINYDEYLGNMDRARLERPIGIGAGVLGTALLASGIVRLLWSPAPPRETALVIEPRDRGLTLGLGGRF
jgi:hypothetical protein